MFVFISCEDFAQKGDLVVVEDFSETLDGPGWGRDLKEYQFKKGQSYPVKMAYRDNNFKTVLDVTLKVRSEDVTFSLVHSQIKLDLDDDRRETLSVKGQLLTTIVTKPVQEVTQVCEYTTIEAGRVIKHSGSQRSVFKDTEASQKLTFDLYDANERLVATYESNAKEIASTFKVDRKVITKHNVSKMIMGPVKTGPINLCFLEDRRRIRPTKSK